VIDWTRLVISCRTMQIGDNWIHMITDHVSARKDKKVVAYLRNSL